VKVGHRQVADNSKSKLYHRTPGKKTHDFKVNTWFLHTNIITFQGLFREQWTISGLFGTCGKPANVFTGSLCLVTVMTSWPLAMSKNRSYKNLLLQPTYRCASDRFLPTVRRTVSTCRPQNRCWSTGLSLYAANDISQQINHKHSTYTCGWWNEV